MVTRAMVAVVRPLADGGTFSVLTRMPPTVHSFLSQIIIDVELLGFVYHWGLDVNSITVIGEYPNPIPLQLLCGCCCCCCSRGLSY